MEKTKRKEFSLYKKIIENMVGKSKKNRDSIFIIFIIIILA